MRDTTCIGTYVVSLIENCRIGWERWGCWKDSVCYVVAVWKLTRTVTR